MNIKNILCLTSLLCVILFMAGCTSNASDKLEGRWVLDVKKTRNYTPPSQEEDSLIDLSKNLMERGVQSLLEDTELTFNTQKKTVSGKLFGVSITNKQYGIIEDSADKCTILVLTNTLIITPQKDALTMQRENGDTFYFNKVQ